MKEELEQTVRYADELYTKFVATPPREGSDFFRLVKTKQMVFAPEGYLAKMLRSIIDRDQDALKNSKAHFTETYIKGSGSMDTRHISQNAVDQMIADTWDEAGRNMLSEKNNVTLQGDRRNDLRSNISDILRWYALAEQSAGLTWQNERGEKAYERLRPVLAEQLEELARDCDGLREDSDPQQSTGLFLLAATARELRDRLENR